MRLGLNPHVYVLHLDSDVNPRRGIASRAHHPPDESIHRPAIAVSKK
jgi:hypothetical protein